jgi:hypothetical protein
MTLIGATARVSAQTDSGASPRWCWRGRPVPQCDAFWITESGGDFVVSSTQEEKVIDTGAGSTRTERARHFDNRWSFTIGPMFNTAPLRAMGGTLSIGPVSKGTRIAAELRRRWWTPEGSALDLTIGAVGMDTPHLAPRRPTGEYGLTVAALLVGGDVINFSTRADLLLTGRKPMLGTSVGMGLGSRPAVYGTLIAGLLVIGLMNSGLGTGS